MNRWTLGAAVVMILGCGGGMIFVANSLATASKAAVAARKFADQELPRILRGWNSDRLIADAHPKLLETSSKTEIQKIFGKLRTELGEFEAVDPVQTVGYSSTPDGIVVSFQAAAKFAKKRSSVRLKVVRKTDTWQIGDFRVGT